MNNSKITCQIKENATDVVTEINYTTANYIAEPNALRIMRIILYVGIFLVGAIGNVLVFIVVYRTPSLRSVTGYMIVHLAIADLMVVLFCLPVTLISNELQTWPFGSVMCKILPFAQALSVMGSVGTLTVISVDRYRCIVNTLPASRLSMSYIRYVVCLIWMVALLYALPLLGVNMLQQSSNALYCVEKWPQLLHRTIYNTMSFALTYAIPLTIMSFLYIKIVGTLNKHVKEGNNREGFTNQEKKDKVLRMLLAVIIAYASCFLPYHVVFLWGEYGEGMKSRYYLLLQSYAVLLVYINSALNPILYAFMGERFRNGFKQLLYCKRSTKRTGTRENKLSAPLARLETTL